MVYNQDLPRYNAADITESFREWKEKQNIATNSANIAENIKIACTMNKASFNGITNSRITEKAWGQR